MKAFETKNEIKERIIREAIQSWSYKNKADLDLNAFDPIVDLLLGATAGELEKLSHDIANSRNRIFERLVEILTPDRMKTAQPAYAIAHALPTESTYFTNPADQFFFKNPEIKKDIFFAPLKACKLQQISIEKIAYDNKIIQVAPPFGKDLLLESSYGHYIPGGEYYIGLKVDPSIQSLEGVSFFFDWKNDVSKLQHLQSIPLATWSMNSEDIETSTGLFIKENHGNDGNDDLFSKMGMHNYSDETILRYVNPHFITIDQHSPKAFNSRLTYPTNLSQYFLEEELLRLQEELLWVKISFPTTLQEQLHDMDCSLNCFPVINRRLIEKQEKLNDNIHLIPVDAEGDHFLSIEELTNEQHTKYREMPLKIVDDADYGIYALRSRGVKRFDRREATHMIEYVIDLMKDEAAAYNSLEYGNLSNDVNELKIVFNRLKKNVTHSLKQVENTSFIFIRPFPADNLIYLKYWTTNGDLGNRIPHGTALKLFSNAEIQANTLQLVTGSSGGRNQLQAVDSIHAFKEAILTRGKLVTSEDFKNFCVNALGFRNIQKIEIKKGVFVSPERNKGLVRCIDVHITRRVNNVTDQDWNRLCHETEIKLKHQSSSIHPIRIITNKAQLTHA